MKFSTLFVATGILSLTSATRLCDRLIEIKSDINTLSQSLSSNITDRSTLITAFTSLNSANNAVNGLNSEVQSTTTAINSASNTLSNLDVQTACWIGWLTNLGQGLSKVSQDLMSIYSRGAGDFQAGNLKNVQGYRPQVATLASQALDALNQSNKALATLNQYNDDVLCWTS